MKKYTIPFLFTTICTSALSQQSADNIQTQISELIEAVQESTPEHDRYEALFPPRTEIYSVEQTGDQWVLRFSDGLIDRPFFSDDVEELNGRLAAIVDGDFEIEIEFRRRDNSWTIPFENFITSEELVHQRARMTEEGFPELTHPVVQRPDYAGPERNGGLENRNLVISASHGWTWHKENRWQLQRARVFTIVEDLFPMSYINPFLIPMLENAGANVFTVRERDFQVGEVIVDNDGAWPDSQFLLEGRWQTYSQPGWRAGRPAVLGPTDLPFSRGTTMRAPVIGGNTSSAIYTPDIPHDGNYAVYLSWPMAEDNSPSVQVIVQHPGGQRTFRVNQQVAGGTWIYLDSFDFKAGADEALGSVTITTEDAAPSGKEATFVAIDAVRFGGGMGNIAPEDQISHKPRYAMASRYFLQYAGAPEELFYRDVSIGHFGFDYNRDVVARAEWPNYLTGGANGINGYESLPGLGVPIDMKLSWHTDAGHDEDGIHGPLFIYRVLDEQGDEQFPDGRSRWLNRDLTSIMADEIMRTTRQQYTSTWERRRMFDGSYSEARRPNIPSTLLELMSHHNFNDLKYGVDPRYKRDISRAIYKSIVKFLAWSNGFEPVIQPLPPGAPAVRHIGDGVAEISWDSISDPYEPTAEPDGFIVYMAKENLSFDNGRYTENTSMRIPDLEEDTNYFFRVSAANAGGESFPTAVVGMRWAEGAEPVMIVDAFDRISGPAIVHEDRVRGFDLQSDPGVGYRYNLAQVGEQYEFDPNRQWENDLENPGRGGSQSLYENSLIPGNTFDHIYTHGQSWAALGIPFDSATRQGFERASLLENHRLVDWIGGLQKATPPFDFPDGSEGAPDRMETEFPIMTDASAEKLEEYMDDGGKLLISGAYLAHDMTEGELATEKTEDLADDLFDIDGENDFVTDATTINYVVPTGELTEEYHPFRFGRDLEKPINIEPTVYTVHSAEAFPDASKDETLLIYGDSRETAGFRRKNATILGFPLGTVLPVEMRAQIMKKALEESD